MSTATDTRFSVPLYTLSEAARFLGVSTSTFSTWTLGYRRLHGGVREVSIGPILTSLSRGRSGEPTVPFIGLAEGMVVAAFRNAGVSMQHLRAAVAILEHEIGLDHALASKRLYTDGAVVLFDYAEREGDEALANLTEDDGALSNLTIVGTQQRVFSAVVREHLQRIEYGTDPWALRLTSPATAQPAIVVDPNRGFGQPIFLHGAARVEDVIDRWRAGESLADVADDFGVPLSDIEGYLRVAVPAAA